MNALIKKYRFLFVFLVLFISSCKKERGEINADPVDISLIERWFNEQISYQPLTSAMFKQNGRAPALTSSDASLQKSGLNNRYQELDLRWKNAKFYKRSDSTIIEVPLISSGIFKFDTEIRAAGEKIRADKSITRVLFIKTAKKLEGYFMTIISSDQYLTTSSSNPANNTFLNKEQNFSGTVVYHDLHGNMINAIFIDEKKANKKKLPSSGGNGKISIAYPDNCKETPIYEVIGINCYDIGTYYVYCDNVYSVYIGHTICGSGGPGGNGSGGGSAGGGSGGGSVPNIPSSRRITNNVSDLCLSTGVNMATNANTTIKNMLNLTFGGNEYTDHDVTFNDVTDLSNDVDGTTTSENQYSFVVNLNKNTLPQRSKEYILATVYHEILHAYLFSKYPKDAFNKIIMPEQHNVMADNYISLMTGALKTAYPNITTQEAWALSWGGLQNTPFYTSKLTPQQREEIQSINNKHRKSTSDRLGTYCN